MLRRLALAVAIALAPVAAHAQFANIGPTPPVSDNGDRLATTAWVNSLIANGLTLASGKIWIGSAGNIATPQTPSGDCTFSLSGVITCTQAAGNFTVVGNLSVGGAIIDANGILATNIVAPATPAAGATRIYVDSTTKVLTFKNDAGTVGNAVVPLTCAANQFGISISAAGVFGCAQPGIANISGLGAGVATFLGTSSSANLRAALTDETGTGLAYFQGGDIGTPSAGVGTNLTALNASNLASGTVAAARGGAGTITGALKGSGAGVVTQAACADLSNGSVGCSSTWPAWTTFTPSPACGTATFTVNSAKSYTLGKTTFVQYDITISAIGTCTSSSSSIGLNTPNTLNTGASLNGYDSVGGFFVYCYAVPAATVYQCRSSSNMVTNSHFYLAGVYENQ